MAVSYNKLWKLLVDKKMSKSDLRKKAEIAPNTMTKLRRDEEVSLTILSKICKTLNADFGDIVEYVPDAEIWDLYNENRELLGKDHVRGEAATDRRISSGGAWMDRKQIKELFDADMFVDTLEYFFTEVDKKC